MSTPAEREAFIRAVAAEIVYSDMVLQVEGQTLRWRYWDLDPVHGGLVMLEGRPWPLHHVPDENLERETVTTAFLAVRTIHEHEAREHFQYGGGHPFNPHTRPFAED